MAKGTTDKSWRRRLKWLKKVAPPVLHLGCIVMNVVRTISDLI